MRENLVRGYRKGHCACITLDLYRKRPGGEPLRSRTSGGPGRFGSSREKEAAPHLAGQLLIGYSIDFVIRDRAMLLRTVALAQFPHGV